VRRALWSVGLSLGVTSAASADVTRAAWTASPVAVDEASLSDLERAALTRCGKGEAALMATGRVLLERKLAGGALPELDGIAEVQRAQGEPHPWARAWAVRAHTLGDAALGKLEAWLGDARRARRCGVASGVAGDGTTSLIVVTVDALADLAPLPMRARTGQWLSLEARLRTAARGATVVVLGPSGATRTVPSWMDGATVRARFAAEAPGRLSVQVVADLPGGPRPVIEADVLVDSDPATMPEAGQAPGEEAVGQGDDDEQLARMVAAARASAGLAPLVRDARLDAMAREHARRMAAAHELAHDAGDGDPPERMRQAGLDAHVLGENVAHAPTVALAHRALWRSPSHRMNLLRADFDRVGVAVVRDEGGEAWVVEVFAGGLGP
jgi:uncharacterized protein YkwD